MISQSAATHFMNQQLSYHTLGNAQPTFLKKEALINVKYSLRVVRAFLKQLPKILFISILPFDHLKPQDSRV